MTFTEGEDSVSFVMASEFFLTYLSAVFITLARSQVDLPAITTSKYNVGDVRNCPVKSPHHDSQPLYQMEVLPGNGFDNLRNMDMGQVHALNFSNCQISKDGKHLLPDSVFILPVHQSKVNAYAEYFEHWDDYTSMTSSSINLNAGYYSVVSGKLSTEYSTTKSHMHNDKATSTRVQIRNKRCVVKLQPGSQLHPSFKSHVYDIAASIQNNNTEYAHYLSELLIREYGTHFITSIDAGAVLSQTDFIRESDDSNKNQDSSYLKASASANFYGKLNEASFEYGKSHNNTSEFINKRTYSQVVTMGGPPFKPNMSLAEWANGVPDALVAIDRSGDPLHFVINPTTLPRLPETTVRMVANYVQRAINRYYKANTHVGCTDPNADNFNFQANLDNGHCSAPNTNFTFGGIFQKCTPDSWHKTENLCTGGPAPALQVNSITGDLSCPPNYTPVLLHSGPVTHITHKRACNFVCNHCTWWNLWSLCCQCESILAPFLSIAHYKAYWCAALPGVSIPQDKGFLFGGFYTSKTTNPITGAMTCPRYFYPIQLGEDIKVCISTDYEHGFIYAVEFGGLESCSMGNPLADSKPNDTNVANWPHSCPHGYTQHLVAIQDGCEINFCVRAGSLKSSKLITPILPPFRKHPKYKVNVTDSLTVFGVYGNIWVKNTEGGWDEIQSGSEDGQSLLSSYNAEFSSNPSQDNNIKGGLNSGAVATLSIVITLVLGVVVMVGIFTSRFAYKRRKNKSVKHGSYKSINEEQTLPIATLITTELPKSSDASEEVPV